MPTYKEIADAITKVHLDEPRKTGLAPAINAITTWCERKATTTITQADISTFRELIHENVKMWRDDIAHQVIRVMYPLTSELGNLKSIPSERVPMSTEESTARIARELLEVLDQFEKQITQ